MTDKTPLPLVPTNTPDASENLSELDGLAPPGLTVETSKTPALAPDAPAELAPPTHQPLSYAPAPFPRECPRCGEPTDGVTSRCAECGYRFLVRCPKCGAVNSGEATACTSCGHRLISAAHGAWMVGPPPSGTLVRRGVKAGARGRAAKRHGLRPRPRGHSPLFFLIIATGAIVLALGVILVLLILAQNPHLLDGMRPVLLFDAARHPSRLIP